jgi:hypothetical protein
MKREEEAEPFPPQPWPHRCEGPYVSGWALRQPMSRPFLSPWPALLAPAEPLTLMSIRFHTFI